MIWVTRFPVGSTVIQYGTPEQKERFLRPFADDPEGDLLASYAFTDVAGGANFDSPDPAGGMQTIARRDGDEWVITGEKHYTTNGTGWDKNGCELYTVVCRTDPAAGADDALAVIAVPGAAGGITVADVYDKIGHRGVVTPRVHFDQVRVPVANLIGQPGRTGKRVVAGAFSWTAALIGAACVGTMRVVGIASYTKDLAPLEKIMRDAMVFPLYDGGNQGVRRRQLHDILRHPGYDSMLAARGEGLPEDR